MTAPTFSRHQNNKRCNNGICMAAEGEEKLTEGDAIEAGGAVYDDEVEAPRDNVSNAMKERLMREASAGLDSNQSQTNVILYISIAVVALVALGGQGILY